MRKDRKSFLFCVVFIVSIILCILPNRGYAEEIKSVVKIEVTNSGNPVSGGAYSALNIEPIYSKISSGEFSKEDITSSSWTVLKQTYSAQSNIISLSNGLQIGPGIKHTTDETMNIIRLLMNSSVDEMFALNGSKNIAPGGMSDSAVKFGIKGVKGQPFTDKKGEAVASLTLGYTAIMDSSNKLLKIVEVTENMKTIKIDITSPESGLKISVTNLSSSRQSATNQYTIEYGKEIEYELTIDHAYYPNGGTLRITPKANLVVDEFSQSYQQSSAFPPIITPSDYDASISSIGQINANREVALAKLGNAISALPLYNYDITIPPLNEDIKITLKAHIQPKVDFNTTVTFPPSTETLPLDIPIVAYNDPNASFGFEAMMEYAGENSRAQSPRVSVTGINFVEMNTSKRKLVSGGEYILGKTDGNETFLYSSDGNWESVGDLNNLDMAKYMKISPGNMYVIGVTTALPIPLNTALFDFKESRESSVNESLIKINGLENNGKYFLYPVAIPRGYTLKSDRINFSAFRDEKYSSISKAKSQDYKINRLIPDFSAGSTEYNILSVTPDSPMPTNPSFLIKSAIAGFVLIIFGITAILIKKF